MSQLSYVDYTTNQDTAKFSIYDTYGLEFKLNWKYGELATQMVTYKLNDNYSKFICTLEGIGSNGPGAYINIYGNNKQLLYASPCMNNNSAEIPVDFDINGQKILYIEILNAAGESNGFIRLKDAKIVR